MLRYTIIYSVRDKKMNKNHEVDPWGVLIVTIFHSDWHNQYITILYLTHQSREKSHHLADDISKSIFLNENYRLLIIISRKFVVGDKLTMSQQWFR